MSVTGISNTLNDVEPATQSLQSRIQQFKQGFEQLGQDLQSGNLSAAQSAFAALPKPGQNNSTPTNSPIEQAFSQLAQNLQSGNLTGANQDYKLIEHDIQNRVSQQQGGNRGQSTESTTASGTGGASFSVNA
jgi:cell division septum initiation protein DivIVA